MKKNYFLLFVLGLGQMISAQETDSTVLRIIKKAPITSKVISGEELNQKSLGQDIPFLLKNTPGAVSTSDAGAGIGYTGIRIRGLDQTRINVSLNGIPLNDSESQGVFWVNLPDLSNSVDELIIQRGVGTSNFGPASFGASINIETQKPAQEAYLQAANSIGSFNTRKHTFQLGTGKIGNYISLDGRVSFIDSDGFVDRASSDLFSYFANAQFKKGKTSIRLLTLGGKERTYQSWYGVDRNTLDTNRTYNVAGEIRNDLGDVTAFYENQVDDYQQDHYQLILDQKFANNWKLRGVINYTYGRGFYEEYQDQFVNESIYFDAGPVTLSNYNLTPINPGSGLVEFSDVIRRRWLDNHFYGFLVNLDKKFEDLDLNFGLAANRYDGVHFGNLLWVKEPADYFPNQEFYRNQSTKDEANFYTKAFYKIDDLELFADLQLRYIDFSNEIPVASGIETVNLFDRDFLFFNPKIGAKYKMGKTTAYATTGISRREPTRSDIISNNDVKHENLYDLEIGLNYNDRQRTAVSTNLYAMYFTDQLVLTGQLDDVGATIRKNVGESYRMGLEIDGSYKLDRKWTLFGNLALSENKIIDHKEEIGTSSGTETVEFGNATIAFSPSFISNLGLDFSPIENLNINLVSKFVSDQFMSNENFVESRLDEYFISDLFVSYDLKNTIKGTKQIKFSLLVNNLFNEQYENNGGYFNFFDGNTNDARGLNHNPYYYPQAGTNFLAGVQVRL